MNFIINLVKKVLDYFNLEKELENHDVIYQEIEKSVIFKGTNLWILAFAIIIASIGLNMNSTAVIIGAMLISPLMGPINGIGYSIATYNFELFRKALKNFLFAVITSLITSTIYFFISPISKAHSELLARTSPSIYDVLIAYFGGLAGIVALSTKQKGNVIPGVAIATALMPPLCTAGYGLATGQLEFFVGAFYLFLINTVFIALASVSISQILKFPIITIIDRQKKKRINQLISTTIVLVTIPSIYFGYVLVQKERFIENAENFISGISNFEGNYLLDHKIDPNKKEITLTYAGSKLSNSQKEQIKKISENYHLKNVIISFNQGLTFENLSNQQLEIFRLKDIIDKNKEELAIKNKIIDSLQNTFNIGYSLLNEINAIYPQIENCFYSETKLFKNNDKQDFETVSVVYIKSKEGKLKNDDKEKIKNWLSKRLNKSNILLIEE